MDDTTVIISSLSSCLFCCIVLSAILYFFKDKICAKNPGIPILCHKKEEPAQPSSPASGPAVNTGNITLSKYWVAQENQKYMLDCGNSKPKKPESIPKKGQEVTLNQGTKKYELQGTGIKVDAYMWDACYCEGTCHVGNTTVNLEKEGNNPKFSKKTGKTWGKGTKDNALVPWVSVTADKQYPYGTTLFIKGLEGAKLPSGETHNGCVRVDDSCGDGCTSKQIDFHVGTYDNYKKTESALPEKVTVSKQACTVKKYKV